MADAQAKITKLIQLAAADDHNAKEELYASLYDDLRTAAHLYMQGQRASDLQTTALVNEVVLRFEKYDSLRSMDNRRVFFSVASRAMNQILVDHYRRRRKLVDSPSRKSEPLDRAVESIEKQFGFDFDRLQLALQLLASDSPRQHAVIMHRFFGGLSIKDTAKVLDVSKQTVERDWRLARAKLFRYLNED